MTAKFNIAVSSDSEKAVKVSVTGQEDVTISPGDDQDVTIENRATVTLDQVDAPEDTGKGDEAEKEAAA